MERPERCDRCKWWEDVGLGTAAMCRRNPPVVDLTLDSDDTVMGTTEHFGNWPITDNTDFCGEFALATPPTA